MNLYSKPQQKEGEKMKELAELLLEEIKRIVKENKSKVDEDIKNKNTLAMCEIAKVLVQIL